MVTVVNIIKKHWILMTVAILIAITTLSLWPLKTLPSVPGTDKTHHFIAYTFLMLPVALRKPVYWVLLGLAFILYSGAIELIQPYVNRYSEWMDLLANTIGLLCGIVLGGMINRIISTRQTW